MAAKGSDPANIVAFVRDLTFQEVHAYLWGFGFIAAGIVAGWEGQPMLESAFYLAWTAVLGRAMLGKSLRELLPEVRVVTVPKYVIRQVRREPHYYIGGALSAYAAQHSPELLAYAQAYVPV